MYMRNEYFFLSNFYPCKITFMGLTYENVEAASQAQKCPERATEFVYLTGYQAKKLGRKVKLREDWEYVKIDLMYHILLAKFSDPILMDKLKSIQGPIIEDNTWGDTFWGVCKGNGQNYLGRLLEIIRDGNKVMCLVK